MSRGNKATVYTSDDGNGGDIVGQVFQKKLATSTATPTMPIATRSSRSYPTTPPPQPTTPPKIIVPTSQPITKSEMRKSLQRTEEPHIRSMSIIWKTNVSHDQDSQNEACGDSNRIIGNFKQSSTEVKQDSEVNKGVEKSEKAKNVTTREVKAIEQRQRQQQQLQQQQQQQLPPLFNLSNIPSQTPRADWMLSSQAPQQQQQQQDIQGQIQQLLLQNPSLALAAFNFGLQPSLNPTSIPSLFNTNSTLSMNSMFGIPTTSSSA
eukprot:m.4648 g.4648  ORF g.4648 m.4648 type:complete len:263 (-) comp2269_c0_seq1:2699-3487(-)